MVRLPAAVTVLMTVLASAGIAQPARTGRTKTGLAYDVQGNGPVVVLITGSNLDRRMWRREAAWLSADHMVVRYDLRAHGASASAGMPFSHVDDLFALLDELGVRNAALVGLSAGSTIAIDAALAAPARVERLAVAGPSISGYVPKAAPPFTADLIAALQQRDYARAGEVLLASTVFAVPADEQDLVRRMVMENDRLWSIPRELLRQPERPAIDRLEEIRIPTLVMIGENDLLQREPAELLSTRVPGARLVVVPRGGHLLNLTSPDEFRAALSAFLR